MDVLGGVEKNNRRGCITGRGGISRGREGGVTLRLVSISGRRHPGQILRRSGGGTEGGVADGGGENGESGSTVCFVGKWGLLNQTLGYGRN